MTARVRDDGRRAGVPVALLAVLVAHLVVATAHGVTHGLVPVWLPPEVAALVLVTTFLGPVVGAALAARDHPLGGPAFTASMAGALVLGVVLHFVLATPDHVHAVPVGPWRVPFQVTAVGVGVTAGAGTLVGARYWFARPDPTRSRRERRSEP